MSDATHKCKKCGALWRLNQPLCTRDTGLKPGYPLHRPTWTLVSEACGSCCDMGDMDQMMASIEIESIALDHVYEYKHKYEASPTLLTGWKLFIICLGAMIVSFLVLMIVTIVTGAPLL